MVFHQEANTLLWKKKSVFLSREVKTWPIFTFCLPLFISLSITLFAPPHLPPSRFLPWSLSFSLTLPQSYIKSYQPLEEHIKELGPVKSYKLSASQYHYMFHPPLLSFPFPPISVVKKLCIQISLWCYLCSTNHVSRIIDSEQHNKSLSTSLKPHTARDEGNTENNAAL